MDNIKNDNYYLQKIIFDADFIINHTKGLTSTELENNEVLIDCILFRIIQIAKNSDKLSLEFKTQNNELPWKDIKGMRNRIVHDYGIVNLSVVSQTVFESIPDLKNKLIQLL